MCPHQLCLGALQRYNPERVLGEHVTLVYADGLCLTLPSMTKPMHAQGMMLYRLPLFARYIL
jgi:hypothetical protein